MGQTSDSRRKDMPIFHFAVTRPDGQQQALMAQLKSLIETERLVMQSPTVKIVHLPLFAIEGYSVETRTFDFTLVNSSIFISKNAVKYLKPQLSEKQWCDLLKKPLYAIGKATASCLKHELDEYEISNNVIYPENATSESLLELSELQSVEKQNWLIIKGIAGRDKLRTELLKRNALVHELEVYQRRMPPQIIQKEITEQRNMDLKAASKTTTVWIVSSSQGLKNLSAILNPKIKDSQDGRTAQDCLVITTSDRITGVATTLGFKTVAQSKNATDEALIACAIGFMREKFLA